MDHALRAPAQPLEPAARRLHERRYGRDFGDVRVREDLDSTRELNAAAYTTGRDIVFAPGRYAPGTRAGNALLGHELAHVVQQRDAAASQPVTVVADGHPTEREARLGEARTRLPRTAVQRAAADAPPAQEKKEEEYQGSGGALTVAALSSPFALQAILEQEFETGVLEELVAQEQKDKRVSRLLERYRKMDFVDHLKYGGGLLLGFLEGVISPIVDLVKMIVSVLEFANKATAWLVEQTALLVTGGTGDELRAAAVRMAPKIMALEQKLAAFMLNAQKNKLDTLRMLGSLADMALARTFAKARDLGHHVADKVLEFFELPWFDLGRKIGYAIGMVTIQIVLIVFSEGIGNALSWIAKGIEGLGSVGAAVVRGARIVIGALRQLGQAIGKLVSWFVGELRALAADLVAVLKDLGELFESLLPRLEAVEAEAAGAGGGSGRALISSAGKDVGAITPRDPAWIEAARPAKVHPANLGQEGVLESRAVGQGGGGAPGTGLGQGEFTKREIGAALKPLEGTGAADVTAQADITASQKAGEQAIGQAERDIDTAKQTLKTRGVKGESPTQYGGKLDRETAAMWREEPPIPGARINEPLRNLPNMPPELADMRVKAFLEQYGDPNGLLGELTDEQLASKVGDLRPDVLGGAERGPVQIYDPTRGGPTAPNVGAPTTAEAMGPISGETQAVLRHHTAKNMLYAQVLARIRGPNVLFQLGETYWNW